MAKPKIPELPPLTHAEVLRRVQHEVEVCGSIAMAARAWKISPQLLAYVLTGERSIGPKLLQALHLRRQRFVIFRYAPAKALPAPNARRVAHA